MTTIFQTCCKPFGRTKHILVWENGDFYSDGFNIFVNPNHFRTWNSILSYITDIIRPSFGAIMYLIDLDNKSAINSFEGLVPNCKYVAVGKEKFKQTKNCYKTALEKQGMTQPKKYYTENSNCEPSTSCCSSKGRRTILFVMANGKTREMPCKVVMTESDMESWDTLLDYIARSLDIPEGVQSLYTVFGDIIYSPRDIQNGCLYVAVSNKEKFIEMEYVKIFRSLLPMREINIRRGCNNMGEPQSMRQSCAVVNREQEDEICKCKSECSTSIKCQRRPRPQSPCRSKTQCVDSQKNANDMFVPTGTPNDVRVLEKDPNCIKIYGPDYTIEATKASKCGGNGLINTH